MLLPRLWRWQTTLECEMLSSPDTLWVFLYGLCDIPLTGWPPTISASLNQTTHGQWFNQWFPTRRITHFFTATQNTTERVEEKNKRTNTDLGQLQGLLCSSPCICRLSRVCILNETSTKPSGMLIHLLTDLLQSSHCLLLSTVSFSGQLSQADRSLLPFFINWLSLSLFSRTFLPFSTSGLARYLVIRPFVWVSCQSRQRDYLTGSLTQQHNEWPT